MKSAVGGGLAATLLLALPAWSQQRANDEHVIRVVHGDDDALEVAQQAVREALVVPDERDIVVALDAGVYALTSPLVFAPEDCGGAGRTVTWRASFRPGTRPW